MAPGAQTSELYARNMQYLNIGHMLIEPVSDRYMQLGSCGTLDENGSWNLFLQLNSPSNLQMKGFTAASDLEPLEDKTLRWGPMTSESVTETAVNLAGTLSVPNTGLPAAASAKYGYSTSTDFGAVLITEPTIHRKRYAWDGPLDTWVKANCAQLLASARREEIKRYGLLIITTIWSTTKASLTLWTDRRKMVFFGFDARLTEAGAINANANWYTGHAANGWQSYGPSENDRYVVSMRAKRYTFHKRLFSEATLKPGTFRSDTGHKSRTFAATDGTGEHYDILCESLGDTTEREDEEEIESDEES